MVFGCSFLTVSPKMWNWHSNLENLSKYHIPATYSTTLSTTNTLMISINGCNLKNNGVTVLENKWLFSSKLTDHTKPWWSLRLNKNKRQLNWTSNNTTRRCSRKDTWSSTSTTKSSNSKDSKWNAEDSWESPKFSSKKYSHSISWVPPSKNATNIAQQSPRNT